MASIEAVFKVGVMSPGDGAWSLPGWLDWGNGRLAGELMAQVLDTSFPNGFGRLRVRVRSRGV